MSLSLPNVLGQDTEPPVAVHGQMNVCVLCTLPLMCEWVNAESSRKIRKALYKHSPFTILLKSTELQKYEVITYFITPFW